MLAAGCATETSDPARAQREGASAPRQQGVDWGTVVKNSPDEADIPEASLRTAISAAGLPWKVRDNRTDLVFVLIPVIDPVDVPYRLDNCQGKAESRPVIQIKPARPFYLAQKEFTVGDAIKLGLPVRNISLWGLRLDNPRQPLTGYSPREVAAFLATVGLRLPSETEWVYAAELIARARPTDVMAHENIIDPCSDDNCREISYWNYVDVGDDGFPGLSPVGACGKSGLGLADLFGNASEICGDCSVKALAVRQAHGWEWTGMALRTAVAHGDNYFYPKSVDVSDSTYPIVDDSVDRTLGFRPARDAP